MKGFRAVRPNRRLQASKHSRHRQEEKPMKKIVLIEPKAARFHVYTGVPIPRLGCILLGTLLRDLGYEVNVFVEEIAPVNEGKVREADVVGVSTITCTAPRAYEWCRIAREAGAVTILGGPHPTYEPEEGLNHADYVVRGEAEEILPELLRALESGRDLSTIQGISYTADGEKIHNPSRPLPRDLDSLPIPDFGLVPGRRNFRIITVSTARGCPFDCSFCSVTNFNGHRFRTMSVDRVLEHLSYYQDRYRVGFLFFADDIFNLQAERAKDIIRGMLQHGMRTRWGAQVRHEASRDEEMLTLMRESRCDRVFVGFESINPKTLELYGKRETVEQIEEAIQNFHRHRIKIHAMFVVGSDEDSIDTIRHTLRFVRKWDIDTVQFMVLTPAPGARDYIPFRNGSRALLTRDWSRFDGHHCVHVPRNLTPYELQTESVRAMTDFYNRRSILQRLVRFDLNEVALRYWGYRYTRRWLAQNADYIESLRDDRCRETAEEAEKTSPPYRGKIAIGLTEGVIPFEQSLITFFQELGVKVVRTRDSLAVSLSQGKEALLRGKDRALASATDHVESLKGEVDYVLLPVVQDLETRSSQLRTEIEEMIHVCKEKLPSQAQLLCVPLDAKSKALRQRLTELGLLFTRDLGAIRRAYSLAFSGA
jgi:radical SAM superfamily enzyme YgiQ (UPF0313 family)